MAAALRNFIENSPTAKFQPEKGRYHLYVALSCPFAHRVLAAINLKGLQDFVGITVVHPVFQRTRPNDDSDTHTGWAFIDAEATPTIAGPTGVGKYSSRGAQLDPIHGASFIRDLYERVTKEPVRYSVPLLWDKKLDTIVSTESADMVRFFNSAFEELNPGSLDLYPESLRAEIDATNEWVTDSINNGVYKVGFAQTQETYEAALTKLYAGLDRVEAALGEHRFIVGNTVTEADIRLFVTLIRFDEAYALRYNANRKLVREYHNIFNVRNAPLLDLSACGPAAHFSSY
jgi:glutathionyl-hydroquinone reductase